MSSNKYHEWNPSAGDFRIKEDDYVKRHQRMIKKQKIEAAAFRIFLGVASAALFFFILHLVTSM
jgi:hypothetical protein